MGVSISDIQTILENNFGIETYDKHISFMSDYKQILYGQKKSYEDVIDSVERDGKTESYKRKHLKKQINTAMKVCKEFSTLMFNEDIDFFVEGSKGKAYSREIDYLKNFYDKKKVWASMEDCIIDVLGVGAVGVSIRYDDKYGTQLRFYDATNILPITITDDEIKECVFIGYDDSDDDVAYITIHKEQWQEVEKVNNEGFLVRSKEFVWYENTYLTIKDGQIVSQDTVSFMSDNKLFAILKPFNRNSDKYSNAFGVPIYLDSISIIERIDTLFHIAYKDLNMSQPLLIASMNLFQDTEGNEKVPDFYEKLVNVILVSSKDENRIEGNSDIIQHINPNTKIDIYFNQMKECFKLLSQGVGLGAEGLSIDKLAKATATQVVSDNNEKYATLKKHFAQMRDEISVINRAILFFANINEKGAFDLNVSITYNTHDNVPVDDETLRTVAQSEIDKGLMSVYSYLVNVRKLSGEELEEELKRLGYDEKGYSNTATDTDYLFDREGDNDKKVVENEKKDNKVVDKL